MAFEAAMVIAYKNDETAGLPYGLAFSGKRGYVREASCEIS